MIDYVTDTHALVWYLENSPRLGSQARAAFDASLKNVPQPVIH